MFKKQFRIFVNKDEWEESTQLEIVVWYSPVNQSCETHGDTHKIQLNTATIADYKFSRSYNQLHTAHPHYPGQSLQYSSPLWAALYYQEQRGLD